jgi:hypothetical protein
MSGIFMVGGWLTFVYFKKTITSAPFFMPFSFIISSRVMQEAWVGEDMGEAKSGSKRSFDKVIGAMFIEQSASNRLRLVLVLRMDKQRSVNFPCKWTC